MTGHIKLAPASRRAVLRLALGGLIALPATGHAPYGQWGVYRKRFLLILTTKVDPPSFALGQRLAEVLAERLPDSRARVSRAPHKARVASLISTGQLDLALMRPDDAAALRRGLPPFADYGPVQLRRLVGLGDFLLVCRADFPARHAWLLARTIAEAIRDLPAPLTPVPTLAQKPDSSVPLHKGARAYFTGEPMPDRELEDGAGHGHEHEAGG
ncbi:hypothetical protein DRB17_17740 [Ferruginivarius sediminum]|uniref:Uncharacterized protein n=1 Tax=Ferruginivarius sediminum TaxID=2661937 RepID=A0A369T8N7_9PROT|nr:hypothetical protein DRB17_17740 [Ferruginivarius sediminum]